LNERYMVHVAVQSVDTTPAVPQIPQQDLYADDDVIDLRRYISAIGRWWREILLIALLLGLLAAAAVWLLSATSTPSYSAYADVAIVRTVSDVTFDERFTTQPEALNTANISARRNALLALAVSPALAAQVVEEMAAVLPEDRNNASALARHVTAAMAANGGRGDSDLIRITATSADPERAARIATTWARAYVEQVNAVYGSVPDDRLASVVAQQATAKADFDAAQSAYEAFLNSTRYWELSRLVTDKEDSIRALYQGRQDALAAAIDGVVQAFSSIARGQAEQQALNITEPYAAEQSAKRDYVATTIDALYGAQTSVLAGQVQSDQALLTGYYSSLVQVTRALDSAQSLRALVAATDGTEIPGSSALVASLLKLQAFTQATDTQQPLAQQSELRTNPATLSAEGDKETTPVLAVPATVQTSQPVQVQIGATPLQIQLSDAGTVSRQALLDELDALNTVLVERQATLQGAIDALSARLLDGDAYGDLFQSAPVESALVQALQNDAPQFLTGSILGNAGTTNAMTGTAASTDTGALVAIAPTSSISQLFPDAELAAAAEAGSAGGADVVARQEEELRRLRSQLEQESARLNELSKARDLAATTFETVSNKVAELTVSRSAADSEVRFAAPAIAPDRTDAGLSWLLMGVLGAAVGLMLGLLVAFVAEAMGGQPFLRRGKQAA
jgi:uncharacterized protein involved in exopolysaccharide biosynthesis